MLLELRSYKETHGHTNVTASENYTLGNWVAMQRKLYRQEGKRSSMKDERVKALNELGFAWVRRKTGGSKDEKR